MRRGNDRPAYTAAFCALMAALGTALMLASGLIPILTYCSPLAAGLLLIPARWEFGNRWAWMTWAVTALLSLLLCADKEAAFFYLFLGYYPILQPCLDRVKAKGARFLAKLAFFALALGAMYGLLLLVLGPDAVSEDLGVLGWVMDAALYISLAAVMLIFDRVLHRFTRLYLIRLRPKLIWARPKR